MTGYQFHQKDAWLTLFSDASTGTNILLDHTFVSYIIDAYVYMQLLYSSLHSSIFNINLTTKLRTLQSFFKYLILSHISLQFFICILVQRISPITEYKPLSPSTAITILLFNVIVHSSHPWSVNTVTKYFPSTDMYEYICRLRLRLLYY